MNLFTIVTVLCALGAGLTAGIFYAFSTFVMAALARLPPVNGIGAMNAINVTVINPWFMAVFLGTPLLCIAALIFATSVSTLFAFCCFPGACAIAALANIASRRVGNRVI